MARSEGATIGDGGQQDRAVSALIGFILLFGILIVGWAVWQGTAVPAQNQQTEFDHNQRVQGELLNLRDSALRTGTTGVKQSTTIQVGAQYARRAIGLNLAISSGRIRLRNTAPGSGNTLYIRGANATNAETEDYFDANVTVSTKSIEYQPKYAQYHGAPDTVIAGGLGAVINTNTDTGDTYNFSIGDQVLISDRTITIVTFNGSLDKAKGGDGTAVTLETEPLSVAEQSITVRNDSQPINLTIPTQIANTSVWNQSELENERATGHVINVTKLSGNYIRVLLERGSYSLRMMRIGLGSNTVDPGAEYLTDIERPRGNINENTTHVIELEVRDKFNNPVDGIQVNASFVKMARVGSGSLANVDESGPPITSTSGRLTQNTSNGIVKFNYTAPNILSDPKKNAKLNFTILDNSEKKNNVTVSFTVLDRGSSSSSSNSDTEFAYVDLVQPVPTNISAGSSHFITVQIRNETHVLDGGVTVGGAINAFNSANPGTLTAVDGTTPDSRGFITFNYTAASDFTASDQVELQFQITSGASTVRNASTVVAGGGSTVDVDEDNDGPSGYNPDSGVRLDSASQGGGGDKDLATLTFLNTGSTKTIDKVRITAYISNDNVVVTSGVFQFDTSETVDVGGPFVDVSNNKDIPGSGGTIDIRFNKAGGGSIETAGDLFIVELKYTDGEVDKFFVTPT
jgi:hypothetical protein